MAAVSDRRRARALCRDADPSTFEWDGAGNDEVSKRPDVRGPFCMLPNECIVEVRLCSISRIAPPSSGFPFPPPPHAPANGRLFDVLGHHRAVCVEAGVLGRPGYALESAAATSQRWPTFWSDLDLVLRGRQDACRLDFRARRRKERTYPELTGRFGRAKIVVLACEVGGVVRRG